MHKQMMPVVTAGTRVGTREKGALDKATGCTG